MRPFLRAAMVPLAAWSAVTACSTPEQLTASSPGPSPAASVTSTPAPTVPDTPTVGPAPTAGNRSRPDWLGQRPLPTDGRGFGIAAETPPELQDRRFPTVDTLPPPLDDTFRYTIAPLTGETLARSTWRDGCPVAPEDLAHLTLSFRGFDGRNHTGELIVAASVAADVVTVFEALWHEGFPLEEMRIVTQTDLDAEPTGDGNNTAGFVCRPVTGGSAFSEHAHGLAIDVNPFQNPYVNGDLVLPELARSYADRGVLRPGMTAPGDVVVRAFADIGWQWGGDWSTLQDWQHFSSTGR